MLMVDAQAGEEDSATVKDPPHSATMLRIGIVGREMEDRAADDRAEVIIRERQRRERTNDEVTRRQRRREMRGE